MIEQALEPPAQQPAGFLLRSHRPGDIGWIVSRHGALYAQEYGWDISFEALAAEIAAQFIRSYDASREHCWIAEIGGEPVGSVFLVKASDDVAKLRLLLVERKARGLGVGRALTEQCIRFARAAGYTSITLWTQSILVAARGIYQRAGFSRVREEKHHSFGADLVGETWELKLKPSSGRGAGTKQGIQSSEQRLDPGSRRRGAFRKKARPTRPWPSAAADAHPAAA